MIIAGIDCSGCGDFFQISFGAKALEQAAAAQYRPSHGEARKNLDMESVAYWELGDADVNICSTGILGCIGIGGRKTAAQRPIFKSLDFKREIYTTAKDKKIRLQIFSLSRVRGDLHLLHTYGIVSHDFGSGNTPFNLHHLTNLLFQSHPTKKILHSNRRRLLRVFVLDATVLITGLCH